MIDASKDQMGFSTLDTSDLSKTGKEILIRLMSSIKTAQIYKTNNLTFIKQVSGLFLLIQNTLKDEREAKLQLRENTLFFNSERIKYDFASYESSKFLIEKFKKKKIGTLCFDPAIGEEEFKRFIVLFANASETEEEPFENFLPQLKKQKLEHVLLEKLDSFERHFEMEEEDDKKLAKKVYFKSSAHLREVFEREKHNKRVHLKTTRRLMQTIVNLIIRDESFMVGLSSIKNDKDYTLGHSINVCFLSLCLGRRLWLNKQELIELGIAALFHDIGRLNIPQEILDKSGQLTDEERDVIEKHPQLGVESLVRLKNLSNLPVRTLSVALEHHARADLSGYPHFWKKKSINLYSQIVEICDFYDAVTTIRPFRNRAFARHEALNMMLERSGIEFNPLLLKIFINMVGVYPIGSLVVFDTGEFGIVMETHSDEASILTPKVNIITDSEGNTIDGKLVDLAAPPASKSGTKRAIIKSLDPQKYNIRVSDYFLAGAV